MFIHPGNVKLCITEEVPVSVNPALSSVPGTGLFHLTHVLKMSVVVCFDLLSDYKNRLYQNFLWEQE